MSRLALSTIGREANAILQIAAFRFLYAIDHYTASGFAPLYDINRKGRGQAKRRRIFCRSTSRHVFGIVGKIGPAATAASALAQGAVGGDGRMAGSGTGGAGDGRHFTAPDAMPLMM